MSAQQVKFDDLYTIKQLADESGGRVSWRSLEWQLRFKDQNGLSAACLKIGKRVYISKSRYEEWLANHLGAKS